MYVSYHFFLALSIIIESISVEVLRETKSPCMRREEYGIILKTVKKGGGVMGNYRKKFLIDVEKGTVQVVEFKEHEDFQRFQNCTAIAITKRKCAGMLLPIVCDDELLSKESLLPSAISKKTQELAFFGNSLIAGGEEEGDISGVNEVQVRMLISEIVEAQEPERSGRYCFWKMSSFLTKLTDLALNYSVKKKRKPFGLRF